MNRARTLPFGTNLAHIGASSTERRGRPFSLGTQVEVEIVGALAAIDPPLLDLVRDRLEYREMVFERGGPLGHQAREATRMLYDFDVRGRLVVGAGAVPGICQLLQQRGHQVTILDHRRWPARCGRTNDSLLAELTDPEKSLVAAIAVSHHGQIVVHSQTELVRAIEIFCRHWPDAIALMPVATRRRLNELYDALGVPLRGVVSKARGGTWGSHTNRIVCTYRSLETVDSSAIDMVIFGEADTMFNQKVLRAIQDLPGEILRFAVVRADQPLDLAAQVRLEALCGPVIWRSPDPRGEPASVRVLVCDSPHLPAIASEGPLDRKRRTLWHNAPRNRMVADIAAALTTGDREALWQHGLDLDGTPINLVSPARVTVLVESAEHGRELHMLLPGWTLLTAMPPALTGESATGNLVTSVLHDRSIVTLAYASKMVQLDPNVFIVTSAEDWTREIAGFPARYKQPTAPPEALVIDLADDYDDTAIRNTRQRLQAYLLRGWQTRAPRRWTEPAEPTAQRRPRSHATPATERR